MSRRRIILLLLAAVLILVGGYSAWMVFQPGPYAFAAGRPVDLGAYTGPSPTGAPPDLGQADARARGEYITRAADCEACHTAKGGAAFAGGRPLVLPFGTIYTSNITPDPDTGIGKWSDAQFLRAVHKGISADGSRLYPAFPYASYTMLTDADVLAIKAYLFSLPPVRLVNRPNTCSFPFNQRWLMAFWSAFFNRDERFRPIVEQSPEWNRGAYLVEAAGHCGECHSPRNLLQAMNQRRKFAGGIAEGWNAYNITSDSVSGIGDWSAEELSAYLTSGHARGRGAASGPMREAVDLSLSGLTPSDIAAIVTYVQSVKPIRSDALPKTAGAAADSPKVASIENAKGQRLFEGNCVSCHAWSGAGAIDAAQLTGSRAVNDPSATNVLQAILSGSGSSEASRAYMPSFADAYSDARYLWRAHHASGVASGSSRLRRLPQSKGAQVMRVAALSLITGLLLGSAGIADESTPAGAATESNTQQSSEPVGTVVFTGGSIAAGVGYVWGHGELVYQGQKHTFSVSGLSIVDVGVANISASGIVYNLTSLDDVSGNYTAASAGLTIAGGGSAAILRNEHGVVIKLVSTSRGLRFNLAAHGVNIKLTS
jgi:mono/diheme cytochrome c family protein